MRDLIDEVEAPLVQGGDVERDEEDEDDGGPALEGVADVAAVVVLHGVVLDAEPGDVNAVEQVKEERRKNGGDFDEGEGGFEAVNFVHVLLIGQRREPGGVDGQMDDDVAAEKDAGEGVQPPDDEMDPPGRGAEGGQVGFFGLVMVRRMGGRDGCGHDLRPFWTIGRKRRIIRIAADRQALWGRQFAQSRKRYP